MPPTIIQAELWTRPPDPGLIVVTANNNLTNRGRLVMGSGAAKQALDRIPDLDKEARKAIPGGDGCSSVAATTPTGSPAAAHSALCCLSPGVRG
jgi:hypothetical protein